MTDQPEALRLADWLQANYEADEIDHAADTLRKLFADKEKLERLLTTSASYERRLHALNAELLDALLTAMPFVEDAADDEIYKSHRVHQILKNIRTAIAKAEGEQK